MFLLTGKRGEHRLRQSTVCVMALFAFLLGMIWAPGAFARNVYVLESESDRVAVIDSLTNQLVGNPIPAPSIPQHIAISPDGRFAYLADTGTDLITVLDTQTGAVVGTPIPVGDAPWGIAFTPNGRFAYVVNVNSSTISVIDTQTRTVVGPPIVPGQNPDQIAITPDGTRAYVDNAGSDNVSVIDLQTNQVLGAPIPVGHEPSWIGITPNGRSVYVVNSSSGGPGTVSVIDTATNAVVGSPIPVGEFPVSLGMTPDGRFAYVVNGSSRDISLIDTATNSVVGSPIKVGVFPREIAFTPNGATAYVTNSSSEDVSVIDTAKREVIGSPIALGDRPEGVAVTPDQPPHASFTVGPVARPGVPVSFNGAASADPDGTIAAYAWSFGDGQTAAGAATQTHTYAAPGSYQASLTLTDNEGCSTTFVFTGQTASCNGGPVARQATTVEVAYPGVSLRCPKRAKQKGCSFKLRVVAKRPKKGKGGRRKKPTIESKLSKAKLKAGHSTIVSLVPKPKFAAGLAGATTVLVKERRKIGGSRQTAYVRLKVVR